MRKKVDEGPSQSLKKENYLVRTIKVFCKLVEGKREA